MRLPVLLLPLVLAAGLAGCTDDAPAAPAAFPTPAATSFTDGTCALVAEDVLALGRAAGEFGDGPLVDEDALASFTTAQKGLQTVAETAEPEVKTLLDEVVTRAGLVRLTAEAERYAPEDLEPLQESYGRLVDACTDGDA